jgi:hypothetical protein
MPREIPSSVLNYLKLERIYKMGTPIIPSISLPNMVETALIENTMFNHIKRY